MITKNTVLILGAGASSHLDYPLGKGLINEICSLEIDILPILLPEFDIVFFREFIQNLKKSQFSSIDQFLENNEKFLGIGKLIITIILKKYDNENKLFPPNSPGWYFEIFNYIINCLENNSFKKNNLTIITLNYDRSLEHYLFESIKYRLKLKKEDVIKILKNILIIHIHGCLGEYPKEFYSNKKMEYLYLKKLSQNLKLLSDIPSENEYKSDIIFWSNEYKESYKHLKKAERIYFLGFGFHEEILERFKFFNEENLKKVDIKATYKGYGQIEFKKLLKRLNNYGIKKAMLYQSSCNDFFRTWASID